MRAQPAQEPVRILLLFGLPPEAPAVAVFTQQLRRTVRNEIAVPVEFYEEFLDFDRFPGRTPQLATLLRRQVPRPSSGCNCRRRLGRAALRDGTHEATAASYSRNICAHDR